MNPNSKLWLCKTNLENDYKNTLTFSSKANQRNYFLGDPTDPTSQGTSTKMYSDYTYLRIESAIKVDDFIENIDTNNYAVILNNSKYYYYFITSMEYIDNETTKIYIELDVMQTYYFDIVYKQSFVEREHVADDTIGKHTLPEGLETGDYVRQQGSEILSQVQDLFFMDTCYPVFAVTHNPSSTSITGTVAPNYNGCWSGLWYIAVPNDAVDFARFIQDCNSTSDCEIYAIFMLPKIMAHPGDTWTNSSGNYNYKYDFLATSTTEESIGSITLNKEDHLDSSYVPRNNKLLTYPYRFLRIHNNAGNFKVFKYENFTSPLCGFDIKGGVNIGGDILLEPLAYREGYQDYDIQLYKLPTCSWISDSYTNWLTQNSLNEKMQIVGGVGGALIGTGLALTGNPLAIMAGIASISSGVEAIVDNVKEHYNQQKVPDQIQGGANKGNINFAEKRTFAIEKMTIKEEYARVIDKFFDQFGYQVNELKSPNIHTRKYWNFLKTQNCNFTGDIPQEYMNKIKTIFDAGITFWHDPSKMFDYSQTNSIL